MLKQTEENRKGRGKGNIVISSLREGLSGRKGIYFLIVSVILLIAPIIFWKMNLPFPANALLLSLMFSITAMAWNLLEGYTGQLSFGHAVFFGVGAYTTMILMLYYRVTPWIGMFVGGFMAALVGLALGIPLFRLRSHWFALATIAVGEIFKLIFISWDYVGGSAGLQAPIVPEGQELYYLQYAGSYAYIYLALGILGLEMLVLYPLVKSRTGYYMQAVREDENAAMSLGINPFKYKMIAMFFSALFTGIGGGIYTVRYGFIDPFAVFDLITVSVYITIAGILGGIYSFIGPIVGSFIFVPASEYVRVYIVSRFPRFYGLHVFVLGLILLIISLVAPEGIMGWLEKKGYLRGGKESGAPEGG